MLNLAKFALLQIFGSDYPFITPQRWLKDFEAVKIEFKPEVRQKLLWRNGQKLAARSPE